MISRVSGQCVYTIPHCRGVLVFPVPKGVPTNVYAFPYNSTAIRVTWETISDAKDHTGGYLQGYLVSVYTRLTSLTSLFILQPEDHRPMWYIHTLTGEHRYKHRYNL